MIPIESATSRDVLAMFLGTHDLENHSLDGVQAGNDTVVLVCSCGTETVVSSTRVDETGWKFGDLIDRMKQLGQLGRSR